MEKHETPEEIWKRENAEAIQDYNEYVKKNGLPLDKYRKELWEKLQNNQLD